MQDLKQNSFTHKIESLKEIIEKELNWIKNRECIYLGLPYYTNIGDALIWEGTMNFLNKMHCRCLYYSSKETYREKKLKSSTIIFLQGGGNFGDLYREEQNLRLKVIQTYKDNPIVILPQSVWYTDAQLLNEDSEIMSLHPNLTICARDRKSYDFLKLNFSKNKIKLLPDMAFFLKEKKLKDYRTLFKENNIVYFNRADNELKTPPILRKNEKYVEADWPTFNNNPLTNKVLYRLFLMAKKHEALMPLVDLWADKIFRPNMVNIGIRFMAPFSQVITTRLHALILGFLLHKNINYIDNITGKISSFVDTWLEDQETVRPYYS